MKPLLPNWYVPPPVAVRAVRSFHRCKRFFGAFMFSERHFPGLDHSELWTEEEILLPCPTVSWGSRLGVLHVKPSHGVCTSRLTSGRCASCPALLVQISKGFMQELT